MSSLRSEGLVGRRWMPATEVSSPRIFDGAGAYFPLHGSRCLLTPIPPLPTIHFVLLIPCSSFYVLAASISTGSMRSVIPEENAAMAEEDGGTGAGSSGGRRRKTSSRSSSGSDGPVVDGGGMEARVSAGVGDSSQEKGASLTDSSRLN
ncbi:hypothetical protein ZWY2020_041238 [Hordeum vulgare]|nr:hypothetical protein ZWY2020_041238 [Hordeum vulgare]